MNAMELVIAGTGGFAREVYEWISSDPKGHRVRGFLGPDASALNDFPELPPVLCSEADYVPGAGEYVVLALGDIPLRKKVVEKLHARGARFASYVHHTTYLASSAKLGKGVLVGPMSCVSNAAVLGDFVAVNAMCTIGHDAVVDHHSVISPQCGLMGFSRLRSSSFLGAHVVIAPKVSVGEGSAVSANTTVLRDVPANSLIASASPPRVMPRM